MMTTIAFRIEVDKEDITLVVHYGVTEKLCGCMGIKICYWLVGSPG